MLRHGDPIRKRRSGKRIKSAKTIRLLNAVTKAHRKYLASLTGKPSETISRNLAAVNEALIRYETKSPDSSQSELQTLCEIYLKALEKENHQPP